MCGVNTIKCAATSVKNIKNVWRCRDSRTAKSKKTSRDDGIEQFSIQHPTYFSHYTCIMGLYTELFYAIIPACFHTFCCSTIPTSPYIFNVFLYPFLVIHIQQERSLLEKVPAEDLG